ncbi:MAG: glucose 1-dehydrogenase [Rhodocyclaceae bacterium]|nr:MAG: glucose 1-dehydrogenase [Rhodocyclaceae bacterium]
MEQFSLKGKVAVVTGAGSGLGLAFAEAMAEAGASVVCADISGAGAEHAANRVATLGASAIPVTCDVAEEGDVARLFADAVEKFGRVDIAIANAGIADPNPSLLHEYATKDWKRVMAVNLDGVFHTNRAALSQMMKQGAGKIINIASMWGLAGAATVVPIPAYTATKGAVVNLTRELALEYAAHNIQVNAICPGFFRTRIANNACDDPDFIAATTAFTPMGRIAEPDEIKGAVVYLASSASNFVTGSMLVIDGGCAAR